MAGQQGGGQEPGKDNSYFVLWVIFLVVLIGAGVWFLASYQLKVFFIYLRIYELTGIQFIVSLLPINFIPPEWFNIEELISRTTSDLAVAKSLTPGNITPDVALYLSDRVGRYLMYPFSFLLATMGIVYYLTHVHSRLKHRYNMNTLRENEKGNWPQIKIISTVNLLEEDLDSGPWAMAMTPMQFAKKNNLIKVTFAEVKDSGFAKIKAPEFKVVLNRLRTERAFAAQLGRVWRGVEAMAPYRRAIFAIFAARGSRNTKTAQDMVYQLASSAAEGALDCTGADDLWKKYINTSNVKKICEAHAYEFTVFISMLMFAREDGVLASSDFLWIKPLDRRLWYVINNVGRQTPGAEVGGIFAHWNTESALKKPLSVPMVIDAVNALELALSEIVYIPDDAEREKILKEAETISEGQ